MNEFKITYEVNDKQVEDVKELFANEFWTNTREEEEIHKMLQNTSLLIGIQDESENKLVGFARVLTDFTYIALITDVMVHKDYRKQGLGRMIMKAFVEAPQLSNVSQLELYCRDERVQFYEQCGFKKEELLNFMRLKRT